MQNPREPLGQAQWGLFGVAAFGTSDIAVATTAKSASIVPRIADSDSTVNILAIWQSGEALPAAKVALDDGY